MLKITEIAIDVLIVLCIILVPAVIDAAQTWHELIAALVYGAISIGTTFGARWLVVDAQKRKEARR